MSCGTMFDKIWDAHVVKHLSGDAALLHIDRHFLHELTAVEAIKVVDRRGLSVRNAELTFATPDHVISTAPGRTGGDEPWATEMVDTFREQTASLKIRCFDVADERQGIVHVVGPELGLSLPGTTIVCGDSHTCTHGAFGALAWGIGLTEQTQVLAAQVLRQRRPPVMRITLRGQPSAAASAKDLILYALGQLGVTAASGYAVEFAGEAVRAMSMEERMTLCNLSIEMGSRFGMIAPDDTTFRYLSHCEFAPQGDAFDQAVAHWRTLASDDDAQFDAELQVDVSGIGPQITWGINPGQVIELGGVVPDPALENDAGRRAGMRAALDYMRLTPGQSLAGTAIDRVFIGSCTNSRISDLRAAASVVRGRQVASGVKAWVVPGSLRVAKQAREEGLDRVFVEAGFEWREPGCSMCVGANGDLVGDGERCVSTSNRNFVGRQGPGAMTHLASPVTAAASAISGRIGGGIDGQAGFASTRAEAA
ncbi:3-isopropylmalate dehydratase large subunit [Paraburkholderia antibiotica]|uniref:3-isopropylmalate dehydratase n=1 Tax=Paraburkholderia antibiotica TaxID=2728839 RepID=A0A7X9X2T4_9BURK|nr:3-isopropylmalate dehydratase large subunit [Paraburkholderia antibiotica]NML30377.1 3-isopropylmalate dehydratase large subunit [Paraburkholderia antibiotica]